MPACAWKAVAREAGSDPPLAVAKDDEKGKSAAAGERRRQGSVLGANPSKLDAIQDRCFASYGLRTSS